jgi:hypothetical protein
MGILNHDLHILIHNKFHQLPFQARFYSISHRLSNLPLPQTGDDGIQPTIPF